MSWSWQRVSFVWCGRCLQGAERICYSGEYGLWDFEPCGHRARLYKEAPAG